MPRSLEADLAVGRDSYSEYIGTHVLTPASKALGSVKLTIPGDDTKQVWRYCDQDFLERTYALLQFFQMDKDDWMSNDQQWLTFVFGICVVVVLCFIVLFNCVRSWLPSMKEAISGDYVSRMQFVSEKIMPSFHSHQLHPVCFYVT